ncbi:UNVERIFIED_CONTAM: hypothetical protein K2H54_011937 [Gekko kuhli]
MLSAGPRKQAGKTSAQLYPRFTLSRHRFVALPLSGRLGLQEKVRRKPSPNAVLEAFYSKHRKGPEERQLSGLAKQCDLQPGQMERWFRSRLRQDQPSLTKKFCESW